MAVGTVEPRGKSDKQEDGQTPQSRGLICRYVKWKPGGTMPQLLDPDEDRLSRLRAVRESARYARENLEELRDLGSEYVVLHGEDVLGTGDSTEEAWDAAREEGTDLDTAVLIHVPPEGETYFY